MTTTIRTRPILTLTPFTLWVGSLLVALLAGLFAMARVLVNGLQVTGLSDLVPWGLWITLDLSAIALGAGAFTFSAAVYLFRIHRLEPLARPAVFIGFLGYTSAMLALAMDIGRPDRFYHPLIYWNVHSVLWEITWCVVLYSTVLVIEVFPVVAESRFFERWPWVRTFAHRVHSLTPLLAVLGMGLSLLHQSSLGATYGVLSSRAIWFKPSLPILFIISAVAGGMALTLLATIISSKLLHTDLIPTEIKREVARAIGYTTLAYLYIKLWDWAATSYYSHAPGTASTLQRLEATTPYTTTFWGIEIILAGIVPAVILLYRPLRRNDRALMIALGLICLGVVVNRWNVTLSGLVVPPDWSPGMLGDVVATSYFPTFTEILVAVGIVAYALLGFTLGVRYLPLYPRHPQT
ncbi:MAG: NrfD/PsrC family molybdoenzyme membrane anchor subunit [Anaerolineales bacterium]|nr:polysulfide reductase NrfD [Anaerolineales bacterium]MCS7247720.1 polysulfide reductase NrfD [Anaerolineales bacterium]MDW8161530.1 NrfD/PsrC family molybdoenzyme membrane anchor subunit [Anaerolineales bacterium]MDW8446866.1 NrfD/PsrC family molybdoenzyme membrane anchor subunit [Anaerolineales bacterium]